MRLLPPEAFAPAFERFRGTRVAYVPMPGNWGDRLIDAGAREMFRHYGAKVEEPKFYTSSIHIPFPHVIPSRPNVARVDVIAIAGGGSMGKDYTEAGVIRDHILTFGKPVVVLPSTFTSAIPTDHFEAVYAREHGSLKFTSAPIVPDLALAVTPLAPSASRRESGGLFLRKDHEALFKDVPSLRDPHGAESLAQYLYFAEANRTIVTDCLHFAIAGLYYGNSVTLLPGTIHKNRSMWESWLRDLGALWKDSP